VLQDGVSVLRSHEVNRNHLIKWLHPLFTQASAQPFWPSRASLDASSIVLDFANRDVLPVKRNTKPQHDSSYDKHERRQPDPEGPRQPNREPAGIGRHGIGRHHVRSLSLATVGMNAKYPDTRQALVPFAAAGHFRQGAGN
jgi:hypothetical protein